PRNPQAPPPPGNEEPMNFDFVDKPPKAPGAADMLDFVEDAPKDSDKKKRPPPPMIGKAAEEPTLGLEDEAPAAPRLSKKEEKERKFRERKEQAARDREERERRKKERGPSALRSLFRPGPLIALALVAGLGTAGVF